MFFVQKEKKRTHQLPLSNKMSSKVGHVRVFQIEEGVVLEGDSVPKRSVAELLDHYRYFELKSGWGKLKAPLVLAAKAEPTKPAPAPPVPTSSASRTPAPVAPAAAARSAAAVISDEPLSTEEEIAMIDGLMDVIYKQAKDGKYTTQQASVRDKSREKERGSGGE
jgi:hypothetical protein